MIIARREVRLPKQWFGDVRILDDVEPLFRAQYPRAGYDWTRFWMRNSTPPPLYHGTSSYIEGVVLKDGLVPGRPFGSLDRKTEYARLRDLVLVSPLSEEDKGAVLENPFIDVVRWDFDQLCFDSDPWGAARYARSAPEFLHNLISGYNRLFLEKLQERGIDSPALREEIELRVENLSAFQAKVRRRRPMVVEVRTDPRRMECVDGVLKSEEAFNDWLEREKKTPYYRATRHPSLPKTTRAAISPADIVSITYLVKTSNTTQVSPNLV